MTTFAVWGALASHGSEEGAEDGDAVVQLGLAAEGQILSLLGGQLLVRGDSFVC